MKIFQKEVKKLVTLDIPDLPFNQEDLVSFWQDGRATQPIVLRLITRRMGWKLKSIRGGGFVVESTSGELILRAITKGGLMLAPPSAYGVGRNLGPCTIRDAVAKVDGFLVYDAREILARGKICCYLFNSAYIRMLLAIEEIWENSGRITLKNIELDEDSSYVEAAKNLNGSQLTELIIEAEIVEQKG